MPDESGTILTRAHGSASIVTGALAATTIFGVSGAGPGRVLDAVNRHRPIAIPSTTTIAAPSSRTSNRRAGVVTIGGRTTVGRTVLGPTIARLPTTVAPAACERSGRSAGAGSTCGGGTVLGPSTKDGSSVADRAPADGRVRVTS